MAILEPFGPVTELARHLSSLAAERSVTLSAPGGDRPGGRRQAIAEPFHAQAARRRAQHSGLLSCCHRRRVDRVYEPGGSRTLNAACGPGGRAFANLHSKYVAQRRYADAERYFADGIAYCDEHDTHRMAACTSNCPGADRALG